MDGELATSDEEGEYVERKIEISGFGIKVFPNFSVCKGSLMIILSASHETF